MDLASNAITAIVTIGAVILGGWLTVRSQDRHWQRDHARQWRDVRLKAYGDFLTAFRQYIAFALEEDAKIKAVPHPRKTGELMPFFDKEGRAYREQLETTKTTARLVSQSPSAVDAMNDLILQARRIAAVRATRSATDIPSELFDQLWTLERAFVGEARKELGLPPDTPSSTERHLSQLSDL